MQKKTTAALLILLYGFLCAGELLDDFSNPGLYKGLKSKQPAFSVPGPDAGTPAMRLRMPDMAQRTIPGKKEWDRYEGIRFKVKGDGSDSWGVLYFNAPNFRWNLCYYFPLKKTEWTEYRVAWGDFTGSMPWLEFNTPLAAGVSDIRAIGFGTWRVTLYEMQRIKPHSYDVADLRLVERVEKEYAKGKYHLLPFRKFAEKLKTAGEIRIACVGDSITAGVGAGAQSYAFPLGGELERRLNRKGIRSYNRGIGGSGLLDHIKYVKRDLDRKYDLVTLLIGYNDVGSVSPVIYKKYLNEWLDRIAFYTKGEAAVILIPTLPAGDIHWNRQDDFANVFRETARERNIVICDLAADLKKNGPENLRSLLKDRVHLNPAGHDVILNALTDTILKKIPSTQGDSSL